MSNYAFEGPKWTGNIITWSFAGAGGAISGSVGGGYQDVIRQAFARWASVTDLNFQEVSDSTPGVDVRIGWQRFGIGNQVGETDYSYTGTGTEVFRPGVTITLEDPSEIALNGPNYTYANTSTTLYETALHEIGHSLGLAHSTDPGATMYAAVGPANTNLDASDIQGIQALYGAPAAPVAVADSSGQAGRTSNAVVPGAVSDSRNDFNGDGLADVMLRSASGHFGLMSTTAAGSQTWSVVGWADPSWAFVGTGDFNGDGRTDILLRAPSGQFGELSSGANGQQSWAGVVGWADPSWQVAATGDFNGDGETDVLLRNASGGFGELLSGANGQESWAGVVGWADPSWKAVATGDFNGDGKTDVLLRDASGHFGELFSGGNGQQSWGGVVGWADAGFQVAGVADFNGDGRTDVLIRAASGDFGELLSGINGQQSWAGISSWADPSWQVAGVGDYSGDGRADAMVRAGSGAFGSLVTAANGTQQGWGGVVGWADTQWSTLMG